MSDFILKSFNGHLEEGRLQRNKGKRGKRARQEFFSGDRKKNIENMVYGFYVQG